VACRSESAMVIKPWVQRDANARSGPRKASRRSRSHGCWI
jgi:hypothetical protein